MQLQLDELPSPFTLWALTYAEKKPFYQNDTLKIIFLEENITRDIAEVVLASNTSEGEQSFVPEKAHRGFKINQGPLSS